MTVLLNNQETRILTKGSYSLSVSGALTLEWDIGAGFVPFTGSAFAAAEDVIIILRDCKLRSTLAGANTATLAFIS